MKRSWGITFGAALLAASIGSPQARAQAPREIVVESPTMKTGEPIPRVYTPDGRNLSPPLTWRDLPPGTRELVVVCADFGAGNPPPWVHWLIYNIPATAGGLPEGLPIDPRAPMPEEIAGATHGNNGWGRGVYRGPAPPVGRTHLYHFTVYALDADLDLPPGLTRAEVMEAIAGHVIGRGEMVPIYVRRPLTADLPSR